MGGFILRGYPTGIDVMSRIDILIHLSFRGDGGVKKGTLSDLFVLPDCTT